jgi:4-amino-4-deoxy-L-arabinose transferase-like glycosyltransferase
MKKINGKAILIIVWLLVIGLLVYSRFVNLGWGLPYPMHPDERNMANAIQQLSCKFLNPKECFNPHFFAYGQFPLYLGYLIVYLLRFFDGDLGFPIGFQEAIISLRIISAVASIINVFVLIKIIDLIFKKTQTLLIILILTFSPFFIQFSHFGTTESLLMLFYSLIVYLSMQLLEKPTIGVIMRLAFISGLAVATKVSSLIFLAVPIIILISKINPPAGRQKSNLSSKLKVLNFTLGFVLCTLVFALVFSPHNLINFQDFVGSIRYESEVALGKSLVFYTRQFFNTVPVWFQWTKIFPYVLGWPVFILSFLGFLFLSWKDKKINILRFAFLIYFLPTAFMFAKWSRFMAPILPLMLIFAVLMILNIKNKISKIHIKNQKFYILLCHFAFCILIFALILPGIAYLSVYQKPDVRFQATDWINKNIPENSLVISETANVVDIPLTYKKNINVISFNFYDLDINPELQFELGRYLQKANYIFVPSRRLFANHSKDKYPLLNDYYKKLFSNELGFEKVAEFSSGLNDEAAEETWTVFDHPIIRIYKKVISF